MYNHCWNFSKSPELLILLTKLSPPVVLPPKTNWNVRTKLLIHFHLRSISPESLKTTKKARKVSPDPFLRASTFPYSPPSRTRNPLLLPHLLQQGGQIWFLFFSFCCISNVWTRFRKETLIFETSGNWNVFHSSYFSSSFSFDLYRFLFFFRFSDNDVENYPLVENCYLKVIRFNPLCLCFHPKELWIMVNLNGKGFARLILSPTKFSSEHYFDIIYIKTSFIEWERSKNSTFTL